MPAPSLSTLKADNLFNLEGVVAVITGGSSGIGAFLASTLLANGARVYVVGLDQKQVDDFAKSYNVLAGEMGSSGSIIGVQGDVSTKVSESGSVAFILEFMFSRQQAEAKRLAELIASKEKYVTCLFNNAGELALPSPKFTLRWLISLTSLLAYPFPNRNHRTSLRVPREA